MIYPTVRRIYNEARWVDLNRQLYDPSRHCRGKQGSCHTMPAWAITHRVRRGYRRSFYCEECLPKVHRDLAYAPVPSGADGQED